MFMFVNVIYIPIPVAVRSKDQACGRSFEEIACSNPAWGLEYFCLVSIVCCIGSCSCDKLITRLEESYRICV